MKGHVKIELFDHKTGKIKTTEHENMLTNALAYRAGLDSNDTLSLFGNERASCRWRPRGWAGCSCLTARLRRMRGIFISR